MALTGISTAGLKSIFSIFGLFSKWAAAGESVIDDRMLQGGMHIPCKYRFVGSSEELKKISSYMNNSFVKNLLLLSSVSYDNEVFDEVKVKQVLRR